MNPYDVSFRRHGGRHVWLRFYPADMSRELIRSNAVEAVLREYPGEDEVDAIRVQPHTTHDADESGHCRLCGMEVTA